MARSPKNSLRTAPVLFYDGSCGLCHFLVRYVLARDVEDRFRFAALQGAWARRVLTQHGRDVEELDTAYALVGGKRLLSRSDAALFVLAELGGAGRLLAGLRYLPRSWRDRIYDLIAHRRYSLFGRRDLCDVPRPEQAWKFLEEAR